MVQAVSTNRDIKPASEIERRKVARKRLTIEVSPDLHARIVKICSVRGKPVNEVVRELLERSFPS